MLFLTRWAKSLMLNYYIQASFASFMSARDTAQQFSSLLQEKHHWLILLAPHPSLDAVAAALAFAEALRIAGKTCTLVCPTLPLPDRYSFLPGIQTLHSNVSLARQTLLSLPLRGSLIKDLTYVVRRDALEISITPDHGTLEAAALSVKTGSFDYDAVITFAVQDFSMLGSLYQENAEFFYETPLVNIDHSPANEYFGQVHVIDPQASSVSEILFPYLEHYFPHTPFPPTIATLLLTGIISQTQCFQAPFTRPQTFLTAGRLMDSGANHRDIIQHLYQNKTLPALKLWGRALVGLKMDTNLHIVSSVLASDDFLKSNAAPLDLPDILEELILRALEPQAAFIVYEDAGKIHTLISVPRYFDMQKLFADSSPLSFGKYLRITLVQENLPEASEFVFSVLEKQLRQNMLATPLL